MRRRVWLVGLAMVFGHLLLCGKAVAQDPYFSQFFASPLTLNPALTGRFDGEFRVAGNYRNQWPSISNAFNTTSVSADFAMLQSLLPETDRFAGGIQAYTDEQADGVLKNTYYALSTAYHKSLDENGYHSITLGFQGTFAQKRLNTVNLKFEDQLRSDGFTGITNEIFDARTVNINYFDLNAGVLFSGVMSGSFNYYLGASLYHINRPQETFTGATFLLNQRYSVHGGAYFPVGQTSMLHLSAVHQQQGGAAETSIGGAVGFNLNGDTEYKPTNFYAGTWYRFNDALIPYMGLEFGSFRVGASYDVTLSSLRSVNASRGGFEFSLIYIHKRDDRISLNCPRF